jgi:dephospho-CoA kinase
MIQVGITGNMGSGKTTVSGIFASLGIPIYDADSRAKWLMENETALVAAITDLFGPEAYLSSGELNRPFISQQAFQSPALLNQLNSLVHPAVARDAQQWHAAQQAPYTLREAALLIESGSYKQLDKLILVCAPEDLRIARVMERNGWAEADIRARLNKQLPETEKLAYADFVIQNDGNEALIPQVLQIHAALKALS